MTLFYRRVQNTLFGKREYEIKIVKMMDNAFFEWIGNNQLKKSTPEVLRSYHDFVRIPQVIVDNFILMNNVRWKEMKKVMKMKYCLTQWRDTNPYLVIYDDKHAYIYRKNTHYSMSELNFIQKWGEHIFGDNLIKVLYSKLVGNFKIKRIHIGKSPKCETTKIGYSGKEYDGNTVLLYLGNGEYVLVMKNILRFEIEDKCKKFISPVVKRKYPYPFIVGDSHVYFLANGKYVEKKHFPKTVDWNDACMYLLHGDMDNYLKDMKNI